MSAKKFKEFENLSERLYVDNVPVDNTILSLINQLKREGKKDSVIKTYLYSIGVDYERIHQAFIELECIDELKNR